MFKNYSLLFVIVSILMPASAFAAEVNVYSARKEALIKPVLDKFTAQTGIEVNLITGNADALISRIASEGKFSPADVLLTTDAGRLVRAKNQGLTQAHLSPTIEQHVAPRFRDNENHWFSLTQRARPIMVLKTDVKSANIQTYEQLASKDLPGKLCIRSSSNIYNQSMIAALIHQQGEQSAEAFSRGLVGNLARPPKGGDRDQIKALVAGQCEYAVANTYYLAGMLKSADADEVKVAEQVKVIWPNQQGRGVHVNVSGAALIKTSPNEDNAKKLLDFLLNEQSQSWYAQANHEYPIREGVEWSQVLKDFGEFKGESIPLYRVGDLNGQAVKVMDRAGWK